MVWVARIVRLVVLTCHLILQLKGNQIGTFPKEMPGPDSRQTMGIWRQVVSKKALEHKFLYNNWTWLVGNPMM